VPSCCASIIARGTAEPVTLPNQVRGLTVHYFIPTYHMKNIVTQINTNFRSLVLIKTASVV
jgi:hypothetical protein